MNTCITLEHSLGGTVLIDPVEEKVVTESELFCLLTGVMHGPFVTMSPP